MRDGIIMNIKPYDSDVEAEIIIDGSDKIPDSRLVGYACPLACRGVNRREYKFVVSTLRTTISTRHSLRVYRKFIKRRDNHP
ncbi:hypothetical protein BH23BAC3_BH23BAC3_09120 [soil metagenome]